MLNIFLKGRVVFFLLVTTRNVSKEAGHLTSCCTKKQVSLTEQPHISCTNRRLEDEPTLQCQVLHVFFLCLLQRRTKTRMNPRTVWRRTLTQTHGRATATPGSYARTTRWYAAAVNACVVLQDKIDHV